MNLHQKIFLATASLASLLASCSTVNVKTSADPQADFAKYRTYSLSPTPATGSQHLSPTSFATLRASLKSGLAAKGIQESSKPSFVVVYHAVARKRLNLIMIPNWNWYAGAGTGFYGSSATYGAGLPVYSNVTEGTLNLDFVDRSTRRVIWRGSAVNLLGSQKEIERDLAEAVREMLEKYPPARR